MDGQAYLLNTQTKKVELFYHLQDQHLIGEFFWFETQADDEYFKATDQYNGFLKASEVKKAKLPTIISKKAAKTSDQPASASQLAALKKEITKLKPSRRKQSTSCHLPTAVTTWTTRSATRKRHFPAIRVR